MSCRTKKQIFWDNIKKAREINKTEDLKKLIGNSVSTQPIVLMTKGEVEARKLVALDEMMNAGYHS